MDHIDALSNRANNITESINTHRDLLAQDFRNKGLNVYTAVAADYIVPIENGEIYNPVLDEKGNIKKFETEVLYAFLRRTSDLLYSSDEIEDGSKYAMEIMNQLYRVASLFPNKIPQYFNGYAVNQSLAKYPYVEKGRTYMTYYPDNSIESWQVEKEPIILFALDQAAEGKSIPQTWNELKKMYEESVNSES